MMLMDIFRTISDNQVVKFYNENNFITKGNWFNDNVLSFYINHKYDSVHNVIKEEKNINIYL